MYNSVFCSIFISLCNSHHFLILEPFHFLLNRNIKPTVSFFILSVPTLWKPLIYLMVFIYLRAWGRQVWELGQTVRMLPRLLVHSSNAQTGCSAGSHECNTGFPRWMGGRNLNIWNTTASSHDLHLQEDSQEPELEIKPRYPNVGIQESYPPG